MGQDAERAEGCVSPCSRPRFDFVCQQPPQDAAECRGCNTPLKDWQLVEDPASGPVGIWATTCPTCGTYITVEMDRDRFSQEARA